MANLKAASSDRFVQFVFVLFVNQRMQFALRDTIEKCAHFVFLAGNLKFHSAVRQVTDPTGNVEFLGCVAHRPAKSDALNAALVKYLKGGHGLIQDTGYSISMLDDKARAQNPDRKSNIVYLYE